MDKKRDTVLFLCTGNICRSPMAEALFKKAVAALPNSSPLKGYKIESAGTSTIDGIAASDNAVIALEKVGVELKNHVSQRLSKELIERSIAIAAMDNSHLSAINFEFPDAKLPKIFATLRSFDSKAKSKNIGDPYGGDISEYEDARDQIVASIPHFLKFLEKNIND